MEEKNENITLSQEELLQQAEENYAMIKDEPNFEYEDIEENKTPKDDEVEAQQETEEQEVEEIEKKAPKSISTDFIVIMTVAGLAIGVIVGLLTDYIAYGLTIGIALGLVAGLLTDMSIDKKANALLETMENSDEEQDTKEDEELENSESQEIEETENTEQGE